MIEMMIVVMVMLDIEIFVEEVFGFKFDFMVLVFLILFEYVLEWDEDYFFDCVIIFVILVGFVYNCCVMVIGYYGIGKLIYIE